MSGETAGRNHHEGARVVTATLNYLASDPQQANATLSLTVNLHGCANGYRFAQSFAAGSVIAPGVVPPCVPCDCRASGRRPERT